MDRTFFLGIAQRWQAASPVRRAGVLACFCATLFVLVNWHDFAVDTIPQALVPVRLWRAGTCNLDSYRYLYEALRPTEQAYPFTESQGHLYPRNPVFVSLLVSPLYLPPVALGVPSDARDPGWFPGKLLCRALVDPSEVHRFWIAWARLCAAACTGFAVALSYLTVRRWGDEAASLGLTLLLAFGTCMWTTVAQTIYDHLGAVVCVAALAFVLRDFPLPPWRAGLAAFLAGAAIGMRPTTVVLLFPLGVYLFCWPGRLAGWKARVLTVAGILIVPLCNALLNLWMFGAWYKTGYSDDSVNRWTTPVWEGALGLLLAPNSGLLLQSPFTILALVGGWAAWRTPTLRERGLLCAYTLCFISYWLLYARWYDWHGIIPSSRMLCDGYPLWMPLAVVGWNRLRRRPGSVALVTAAGVWSVMYHIVGIAVFADLFQIKPPPQHVPWQPRHHFWVEHVAHFGLLPTLNGIALTLLQFGLCAAATGYILVRFMLPAQPEESEKRAPAKVLIPQ
jgi:hypothetical protein